MITLETLQHFASTDETRQEVMKPWTYGEHTFATDERIMLWVPKIEGADTAERKCQAAASELMLKFPKGELKPMPTPPPEGWGIPCQVCEGKGKCNKISCDSCGEIIIECVECNGTGKQLWEYSVAFGNQKLNAEYLDKIIRHLKLPRLIENPDPRGPVGIRFDGGHGLLMPLRSGVNE